MASLTSYRLGEDRLGIPFETVSSLTDRIKDSLEADFAEVAVEGELSNLARPKSGHVYFTLKDNTASLRGVMWKSDAQRLAFDLADGLAVRILGRLTVYPPRGEYQVVARYIEPQGIGAPELAFRQLFARLSAEGLFDPERKRPTPRFPRRIVIVTSPTGAAVRDLLQVTGRRWAAADILIAPTRVQGAGAGAEIAAAIALANLVKDADVIIIARGGGSAEDLWAFNEEIVARAVAGSRLPVISAVGHEIDITLADLAADQRALTPSEAGELAVPDSREVAMHLDRLAERLHRVSQTRLAEARLQLDQLADRALAPCGRTWTIDATPWRAWPPRSKPSAPSPCWLAAIASPSWPTARRLSAPARTSTPANSFLPVSVRAGSAAGLFTRKRER